MTLSICALGENLLQIFKGQSLEDLAVGNTDDARPKAIILDSKAFPSSIVTHEGKTHATEPFGSFAIMHRSEEGRPNVQICASVIDRSPSVSYGGYGDHTFAMFDPLAKDEDRMLYVRTTGMSDPAETQIVQPGTPTWRRSLDRIAQFAELAIAKHS